MELLSQLERTVEKWFTSVPHLPNEARKWLADNFWWIAAIAAVLSGLAVLAHLVGILGNLSILAAPTVSYFASSTFVVWAIINASVSLVFTAIEGLLFASAVSPLKQKQKKGWTLLFAALLVSVVSVVVSAVLTFNPFSFVSTIIFGALMSAVWAYFIFEVHGEFAHVERSKGVKAKK